jgi:hypothetical protein
MNAPLTKDQEQYVRRLMRQWDEYDKARAAGRIAPIPPRRDTPLPTADDGDRPDHILHDIPVSAWTISEQMSHLRKTFDKACKKFPEIMEPYMARMDNLNGDELKAFMRAALSETIRARYPLASQMSEAAE